MNMNVSFLNIFLWFMDKKMKLDFSFLNKTLWLVEGKSHGQKYSFFVISDLSMSYF